MPTKTKQEIPRWLKITVAVATLLAIATTLGLVMPWDAASKDYVDERTIECQRSLHQIQLDVSDIQGDIRTIKALLEAENE